MEVQAELRAPSAHVRVVRYHFNEPPSSKLRAENAFRIELSLTPRHHSARGCYSGFWNTSRFESIGDLFVLPPAQDLLCRSDECSSTGAVFCELDADLILQLRDHPQQPSDHLLRASLDVRDARVSSLLLRLADEARYPGFASELLVESLATQMAIELCRDGDEITSRRSMGRGLAPWQLRHIDERLRRPGAAPSLRELAELCHTSVRQLTRGFSASRGCSLGAYVNASQMEHAKTLLLRDEAVGAIANTLGFSSSSNFCFAFRRATGITPGQYRQMLLRR
jgi:AraC family transcriptional regulator